MPVEYAVKPNFVLSLQIFIDDGVFKDILAVGDKKIAKKEGESNDKKQYVLRYDLVG